MVRRGGRGLRGQWRWQVQEPRHPWRAKLRQQRIQRARYMLNFWQGRLDAVRNIIDALDQRLATAVDDEESSDETGGGYRETRRPPRTSRPPFRYRERS
jgi:hypothetical protein